MSIKLRVLLLLEFRKDFARKRDVFLNTKRKDESNVS
jgi:hypothetical protein